ncbi:secreted protein [gut metagenome]|uniref:Secreted protein n=1 Tax=gut metagenome TaxID=749906 RepID=J9FRE4_9ZZZZ
MIKILNFSSKYAFKSSILILSCSIVSRSRTVTAPSVSDSKS